MLLGSMGFECAQNGCFRHKVVRSAAHLKSFNALCQSTQGLEKGEAPVSCPLGAPPPPPVSPAPSYLTVTCLAFASERCGRFKGAIARDGLARVCLEVG